eukprot:Clim_evm91s236 gene=Clim_evmTU91s236
MTPNMDRSDTGSAEVVSSNVEMNSVRAKSEVYELKSWSARTYFRRLPDDDQWFVLSNSKKKRIKKAGTADGQEHQQSPQTPPYQQIRHNTVVSQNSLNSYQSIPEENEQEVREAEAEQTPMRTSPLERSEVEGTGKPTLVIILYCQKQALTGRFVYFMRITETSRKGRVSYEHFIGPKFVIMCGESGTFAQFYSLRDEFEVHNGFRFASSDECWDFIRCVEKVKMAAASNSSVLDDFLSPKEVEGYLAERGATGKTLVTVHLPRGQRTTLRVNNSQTVLDVKLAVCRHRRIDPKRVLMRFYEEDQARIEGDKPVTFYSSRDFELVVPEDIRAQSIAAGAAGAAAVGVGAAAASKKNRRHRTSNSSGTNKPQSRPRSRSARRAAKREELLAGAGLSAGSLALRRAQSEQAYEEIDALNIYEGSPAKSAAVATGIYSSPGSGKSSTAYEERQQRAQRRQNQLILLKSGEDPTAALPDCSSPTSTNVPAAAIFNTANGEEHIIDDRNNAAAGEEIMAQAQTGGEDPSYATLDQDGDVVVTHQKVDVNPIDIGMNDEDITATKLQRLPSHLTASASGADGTNEPNEDDASVDMQSINSGSTTQTGQSSVGRRRSLRWIAAMNTAKEQQGSDLQRRSSIGKRTAKEILADEQKLAAKGPAGDMADPLYDEIVKPGNTAAKVAVFSSISTPTGDDRETETMMAEAGLAPAAENEIEALTKTLGINAADAQDPKKQEILSAFIATFRNSLTLQDGPKGEKIEESDTVKTKASTPKSATAKTESLEEAQSGHRQPLSLYPYGNEEAVNSFHAKLAAIEARLKAEEAGTA